MRRITDRSLRQPKPANVAPNSERSRHQKVDRFTTGNLPADGQWRAAPVHRLL